MAQISDAEKLSRISCALGAHDDGECDTRALIDIIRWTLNQEAISAADIAAGVEEAKRIRPMIDQK